MAARLSTPRAARMVLRREAAHGGVAEGGRGGAKAFDRPLPLDLVAKLLLRDGAPASSRLLFVFCALVA